MMSTLVRTHSDYWQTLRTVAGNVDLTELDEIGERLFEVWREGGTLFLLGNGGSAALASHMACDLGKGTAARGLPRLRVMALTDNVAVLSAWANDVGYGVVFAEQLAGLARAGDSVLAISGSGNSANVLAALEWARAHGCRTYGMSGFLGGQMRRLCDVCWVVPSDNMQIIEDCHVAAAHALFTALRHRIGLTPAVAEVAALSETAA